MKLLEKVIKPEIQQLYRMKDTFDDRFDYLRLDKNERLLPFEEKWFDLFKKQIQSEHLTGYPELGPLYRKLANYLHVSENQILLASGSDLAIKSIYEACIQPGDNIVLPLPSYAMIRVYAEMFKAETRVVSINQSWQVDIKMLLKQVDEKTKMVVLENPSGSIGTKPHVDQIEACASELHKKNVLLLLDEAYYYVDNKTCQSHQWIEKYPNLLISQSFSKAHGLAGLRIGYLIGHDSLISSISGVRPMHEISSFTAYATEWVLDHPEILHSHQELIKKSKEYLKVQLKKLEIPYQDTAANFLMLYLPNEGKTLEITKLLKEEKILIRSPFEEPSLRGWARVTIGSLSDSEHFIQTLSHLLQTN
ncbi:MAG: aminotransferase class I/II-fold pyridoxal phosphate-dependent enzyme [SAR324 cluster bacterium]|nr:aminotransferase class I/II-fold pyridoxal phosphate-dependent enzyme [SAR324 cluster bacterium]